ncbi:MAG: hypothetical protein AAGE52_29075 [Myxococcota bacterium]
MRFLCLALLLACTEPATQTFVRIHADPGFVPEATRLRLRVFGEGELREDRIDPVSRNDTRIASPTVIPDGGPERTWSMIAELLDDDDIAVASLRIGGGFVENKRRYIDAWFDDQIECQTLGECGEGRTCSFGRCVGACFALGADDGERDLPLCNECEVCIDATCQPRADGQSCGCEGDRCQRGLCEPAVAARGVWTGEHQTCASARGGLWCWGQDHAGRVGIGRSSDVPVFVSEELATWDETPRSLIDMAMGADHSCLLWARPGPQFQRTCWGWNGSGAVGLGPVMDGEIPATDASSDDPVWISLASGRFHTCGLSDGGQIFCWGSNNRGQGGLARGATGVPTLLDDRTRWSQVVAGNEITCGLIEGRIECVGAGLAGQHGDGARSDRTVPACAQDESGACIDDFLFVTTGANEVCGIRDGGAAWCWGDNREGRLGIEGSEDATRPRPVMTDLRFRELDAASGYTCGIDLDGGLWCWGGNRTSFGGGQLGVGDLDARQRPTRVFVDPGDEWRQVSAGAGYACGVRQQGDLYCWGSNDESSTSIGEAAGRLGLGYGLDLGEPATRRDALRPQRVCLE